MGSKANQDRRNKVATKTSEGSITKHVWYSDGSMWLNGSVFEWVSKKPNSQPFENRPKRPPLCNAFQKDTRMAAILLKTIQKQMKVAVQKQTKWPPLCLDHSKMDQIAHSKSELQNIW